MARFSIPSKGRLRPQLRLPPASVAVQKSLNRLSRSSLLSLALEWISDVNVQLCEPLLGDDADGDPSYQAAESLEELRSIYGDLQYRKGSKREVFERITEGDWQRGLTLYQLALADFQYLQDNPTSQHWTGYQILPLMEATSVDDELQPLQVDKESFKLPRFHPSTFIDNLQSHVLPDVKAYYQIHQPQDLHLTILRIFIVESPYITSIAQPSNGPSSDSRVDSSRTLFVAFPHSSPYIYLSKSQTIGSLGAAETKSFRNLVAEGIPMALSRPRERFTLKPTNLQTKNLLALLHTKGAGRTNAAGGGWDIYADKRRNESPLDTVLPTPPLSEESSDDSSLSRSTGSKRKAATPDSTEKFSKRARLGARARFGDSAKPDDGFGVERVDITIEDPFPRQARPGLGEDGEDLEEDREDRTSKWTPNVKLVLHGSHVFAGIRQLVENGIIDAERMPGWLTGEEGVTVGAVRHGRVRGHKGSGI